MSTIELLARQLLDNQWVKASGYLSIFLLPALFLAGSLLQLPWLAATTVLLIFPLARLVFGALPASGPPDWNEAVATTLHVLPLVYPPTLAACVFASLYTLTDQTQIAGQHHWIATGLSLWMVMLFATCVAHELIHRRESSEILVGHLVAGIAGYPLMGLEHLQHHSRSATSHRSEVPLLTDSMWRFAARRSSDVADIAVRSLAQMSRPGGKRPSSVWLAFALTTTGLTLMIFAAMGGWQGAACYICAAIGVAFGIQLITYLQHWGLGHTEGRDQLAMDRAWEEDCQFQAWVTLSISLHDRHHHKTRMPYYRLALSPDSPRLPAGYLMLMFASMVPMAWRRVMLPALERWRSAPARPISAGRRLTCFGKVDRTLRN